MDRPDGLRTVRFTSTLAWRTRHRNNHRTAPPSAFGILARPYRVLDAQPHLLKTPQPDAIKALPLGSVGILPPATAAAAVVVLR